MSNLEHLSAVLAAVEDSHQYGMKNEPPDALTGFSGEKLIGLLQRLVSVEFRNGAPTYLEIGVFQGLTLLSAAFSNRSAKCYGIDNFSQFDRDRKNLSIVRQRAEGLGISNYEIIDQDFEAALQELDDLIEGKVSVYFVDGPHDYRSQLVCLAFGVPHLREGSVIVIDDCNYPHVRQATRDFLKIQPDFKLIFEAYTSKHPQNMNEVELADARAGWWNGVNVLVHDPADLIDGLVPPTAAEKSQFFSDHEVHSMAYGPIAVECLNAVQSLRRPWKTPRAIARIIKNSIKRSDQLKGKYMVGNTASSGLTTSRVAQMRDLDT